MSELIYVGEGKSLTIPKKYNVKICGEEEPTPLCFQIKVGKKAIRLSRSGEYPYNEICGEELDDDKPTYLTFWVEYEIVIPSYYMELIDAKKGDAYEMKLGTASNDMGWEYQTIRLTKQQ